MLFETDDWACVLSLLKGQERQVLRATNEDMYIYFKWSMSKVTEAMTRGKNAIAFVASVKFRALKT